MEFPKSFTFINLPCMWYAIFQSSYTRKLIDHSPQYVQSLLESVFLCCAKHVSDQWPISLTLIVCYLSSPMKEKEERYFMLFPTALVMLSASPRMSGFIYQVLQKIPFSFDSLYSLDIIASFYRLHTFRYMYTQPALKLMQS